MNVLLWNTGIRCGSNINETVNPDSRNELTLLHKGERKLRNCPRIFREP